VHTTQDRFYGGSYDTTSMQDDATMTKSKNNIFLNVLCIVTTMQRWHNINAKWSKLPSQNPYACQ